MIWYEVVTMAYKAFINLQADNFLDEMKLWQYAQYENSFKIISSLFKLFSMQLKYKILCSVFNYLIKCEYWLVNSFQAIAWGVKKDGYEIWQLAATLKKQALFQEY